MVCLPILDVSASVDLFIELMSPLPWVVGGGRKSFDSELVMGFSFAQLLSALRSCFVSLSLGCSPGSLFIFFFGWSICGPTNMTVNTANGSYKIRGKDRFFLYFFYTCFSDFAIIL